jgi:GT2 family glycosyltransferase
VTQDARPTIDVVVPVYGNWHLTERCLAHLTAQTVPHRVIVVDDAGPDDTVARLEADYPAVTVVALATNKGFAGACNAGIAAGDGQIVVLVNNDVEAEPELLERLVQPFADDPGTGSASPLLLKPDGRVDAFGICADPTMAGFVRYNGATEADVVDGAPAPRLLGPYGAVAAYRRTALEAVGPLDEGIQMYGEELDLALRLSAAGWSTAAVVGARGMHLGGATSGRGSAQQRRRAGFGRGYLVRAYGVLRTRHFARALLTELIVCAGDLLLSRDLASTSGRLAGWRAGRTASRRPRRIPGVDTHLGFVQSLRLRVGDRRA